MMPLYQIYVISRIDATGYNKVQIKVSNLAEKQEIFNL